MRLLVNLFLTQRSVIFQMGAAVFVSLAILATPRAYADVYPNKPVRLIVPATAGGTSDVIARLLGASIQEKFGQTIVVENKPGASQAIGAAYVAKSPADGYTLLIVNSSFVISPVLIKTLPYDLKELRPISVLAVSPLAVIAGVQQPFTTMREFLTEAKNRPDGLFIGNSESTSRMMIELLKQQADVKLTQVAYKGGAALLPAVMGGQVPTGVLGTVTAAQLHKDKKLRMLAVTSGSRSAFLPDVPTVAESGVPGFDMSVWFALMAPAEVPDSVVTRVHQMFSEALEDKSVKKRMGELGLDILGTTPAEAAATLNDEAQLWVTVAKSAGIKPE